MRPKLRKSRLLPIGIDLGTAVLKMAQLRRTENELELLAMASDEIPEPCREDAAKRFAFLAEHIRDLLKLNPFKGRRCCMAMPASATFVQHVKIAKVAAAEIGKTLRWELEGKLPFEAADAVVRHVVVGDTFNERETGLEVIVVAASRKVVESHLDLARNCGLELVGLDVGCSAILGCFGRLFRRVEDNKRVNLFLDLGHGSTQVVIAHGPKLVFSRNLMTGCRQLDEATAGVMKMTPEDVHAARQRLTQSAEVSVEADAVYDAMADALETLTGEVTKCLRYYESVFPSLPVERAIFLGGQAQDRRLCERMAQRLNLPATIGDPLARIARGPGAPEDAGLDRREAQPAWAVAVGASLGVLTPQAA